MSSSVTGRRALVAVVVMLLMALVVACGGDDGEKDGTATGETTTEEEGGASTETNADDDEGGEDSSGVTATVRLRAADSRKYKSRVEGAKPGDTIVVRAGVRLPKGADGEPTEDLTVVVGPGADGGLVVKTSVADDTRRATVTGAGKDDPSVRDIFYRCAIPPADTFCPVDVKKNGDQYEMVVDAAQTDTPVVLYVRLGG